MRRPGFDPPLLHQVTSSSSITYKEQTNKSQNSFGVILTSQRRIFCVGTSIFTWTSMKTPNENDSRRPNASERRPALRADYAEVSRSDLQSSASPRKQKSCESCSS